MKFLEKLISIKKDKDKYAELMQLYNSLDNKFADFRELYYREHSWYKYFTIYKYSGITPNLLFELEFLNQSKLAWKTVQHQLWLLYICILLEIKDEEKANTVLDRYKYNHGEKDIHLFLSAANFAHKNSITNEKIEKASTIFEKLDKNHKNNIFINLINNKKIALVGNGAFEVDRKQREKIDSNDLVFRFNVFNLKGFEEDYGTKTDVWCQYPTNPKLLTYPPPRYRLLLYRIDSWFIENDNALEIMYQNIDKNIDYIDFDVLRNMYKDGFFHNPTTGGILISYMNSLLNEQMKNVQFYGFKFCAENKEAAHHYYDDAKFCTNKDHDLDYEGEYLRKILKGKI